MAKTNIQSTVKQIISDVRKNGDQALSRLLFKFDKVRLSPKQFRVPLEKIKQAPHNIAPDLRLAMEACARRIQDFHYQEKKHLPQSWTYQKEGVRLGQTYNPMESVGIYVPGGRFSYPSTVLMTAIPARLAGVERIAIVTPPARLTEEILAAAEMAGVKEIYQVGGPGAVAALAIGTKTIPPVDLIVGPGNAFVTEAKRQLFGEVGIDLLAGPSELVVLPDEFVVNFWYAGCAPCRVEAPDLQAVSEQFAADDVKFLGINTRDQDAQAQQFAEEFGVTYPSIMDSGNDRAVQRAFAGVIPLNAVPTTLVLDAEGRVAARILGKLEDKSILATLISDELKAK